MTKALANQREIVDRRALTEVLDAARDRPAVIAALKEALAAGRAEIHKRFFATQDGTAAVHGTAFLMDQIIRLIHDHADRHAYPTANPTAGERMAIIAVGGYGRGELAPQSDIDLLFVHPYKETPRTEQLVEYVLHALWDLGLKVGYATRSLDEVIRQARGDMTIRTAFLEARYLWGDEKLYATARARFLNEVVAGTAREFAAAKLGEREARHKRMGDSRYVVEPNVKEGKGGLRDLHTLFWIAKYLHKVETVDDLVTKKVITHGEAENFAKAQQFLWTLRCHLHYLAGRAEDRLTFDFQSEIARRMGYTDHRGTRGVERLMKHYYLVAKTVGHLTAVFCTALEIEAEKKPGLFEKLKFRQFLRRPQKVDQFVLENDRLNVANEGAFLADPINLLRLFRASLVHGLTIHPAALRLIRHNLRRIDAAVRADAEANRVFMEILTHADSERVLRAMNESGVFGRFVPDFGRVVAQSQHDMYHVYTVDEHTIFAIGILAKIESGALKDEHPLASDVIHKIQSRHALYLAVLLHDIAKGRGGDHSVIGAEIALKMGPRVGLSEEETETVSWLVRYHLAMSSTAFKRDIHDPQTIRDFAALVQSPERLRLLLCLTVCDIKAVGPNVWNNWKAALLRELYYRAEEALLGVGADESQRARVAAVQDGLAKLLADWQPAELERHFARGYPAYFLSLDITQLARHARFVRDADNREAPVAIDTRIDRGRAMTELTVYTADHPGLFSRIAGAMALSGANIVAAQIFTTTDGMALDTFVIQEAGGAGESAAAAFDKPERLARLSTRIEQALSGRIRLKEQLEKRPPFQSRAAVFTVPPRVIFDNKASRTHTVIEVNGRDRPGLLYDVTNALTELGLSIGAAKIATYGERVVDVFYVKDVFGHKVDEEPKLKRIRERLLTALAGPDAQAPAPTPKQEAAAE